MISSPNPAQRSKAHARWWVAHWGAPPEKQFAYATELVSEVPDDPMSWFALENAADACGKQEVAASARARWEKDFKK